MKFYNLRCSQSEVPQEAPQAATLMEGSMAHCDTLRHTWKEDYCQLRTSLLILEISCFRKIIKLEEHKKAVRALSNMQALPNIGVTYAFEVTRAIKFVSKDAFRRHITQKDQSLTEAWAKVILLAFRRGARVF